MKFSQFNSIIPLTDDHKLVYNSYSDSFLILEKNNTLFDNLEVIKKKSQLYEKLLQAQFVVCEEINEVALVKEMQQSVDNDSSEYHLIINPTLDCNFKCWYCYESKIPKSRVSKKTSAQIKTYISNIIHDQSKLKYFNLSFFGGEPFLNYPFVKELMQYVNIACANAPKELSLSINFTTNGYLLNEDIIEELSKYNVTCLQITLDGNREQHDKVRYASKKLGSYDRILRNIKLLLKKNIGVILRINYTTDNIGGINSILNDLLDIEIKSKLDIQFHRVWQDSKGANIDNEVENMIEIFRNKGFTTYRYPLNNVKSSCYADKMNGALINYNGDVYRCTAVNFSQNKREGYLDEAGTIIWENNAFEVRRNAKFKNKPCLNCRILPICNGGCSQKAIEYKDQDYCILNFKEEEKNKAILDKFKYYLQYFPEFIMQSSKL